MDADDFIGQLVPNKLSPGFVFLSILVNLVGSWTTLELLHRRTANRGFHNWLLLTEAAVSMGAVAIWATNYIGEHAVVMASGADHHQVLHRTSLTVASCFLSVVIAGASFYSSGFAKGFRWPQNVLGGLLMGTAVSGTYYLDQYGIINYSYVNSDKHVVGAVLVAVLASTAALSFSSYTTSVLTNTWSKRLACTLLLAASVSGMQWVAAAGTTYEYKRTLKVIGLSHVETVIAVACLSIVCCLVLLLLAYIDQINQFPVDRAQEVGLALAVFDGNGRLMVLPDGSIPCRTIGNLHLGIDETFDVDHKLFPWMYRLSHCWYTIQDIVPSIRRKFRRMKLDKSGGTDHLTTFKLSFCIVAYELSKLIGEQMEDLGTLFTEVLQTGTVQTKRNWLLARMEGHPSQSPYSQHALLETEGRIVLGRGQLLFLMRRVDELGAQRLIERGFQFAPMSKVAINLARSIEVKEDDLIPILARLSSAAGKETLYGSGVHVACFAIRPGYTSPFDVLVRKDANNLLPNARLSRSTLSASQRNFLKEMEGLSIGECLSSLRNRFDFTDAEQASFAAEFLAATHHLAVNIGKKWILHATLAAEFYTAPCSQLISSQRLEYATIIAFKVISNVHDYTNFNDKYEYITNALFMASQHANREYSDQGAFASSLRRDLQVGIQTLSNAARVESTEKMPVSPAESNSTQGSEPFKRRFLQKVAPTLDLKSISRYSARGNKGPDLDNNSSEIELFPHTTSRIRRQDSELTIATTDTRFFDPRRGGRREPGSLAINRNTGAGAGDPMTYAEKLMVLARREKRPMDPEDTDSWP